MSYREALEEERDFCLRSLKDLDVEFAAGDIDDADYHTLRDSYTVRAAAALKALGDVPPASEPSAPVELSLNGAAATPDPPRYRTSWRRRAGAAVGVVVVVAGACWAVVESSATRLPGQQITGQALGSEQVAAQLLAAQKAMSKGDDVTALKAYQKILASQPRQPEALTGEGWLLAQTQQPALLKEGLGMLSAAERAAPDYAPAHLYRGIALLSEDDYADAIPELQWYLGHSPDPQLAPKVRQALQQAQVRASQQ
ncbi:MAG TPA: hypothetical protein VNF71_06350 [Acidimicrobiales bacterium]|nr:hypothetical protein [Acidimicrobiales bacterium]